MKPGRKATRNFSRVVTWVSAAVVIQASSHQVPVGVSTASKPEEFSGAGDLTEIGDGRWSDSAREGPTARCESSPDPTISRLSPLVGRYQCK